MIRAWWFWPVIAGLIIAAALFYSTPARADATDDAFLDVIDAAGIVYRSPNYALTIAHAVCADLDVGRTAEELVADIAVVLPDELAALFVAASIAAYCPQHNLVRKGWVA